MGDNKGGKALVLFKVVASFNKLKELPASRGGKLILGELVKILIKSTDACFK